MKKSYTALVLALLLSPAISAQKINERKVAGSADELFSRGDHISSLPLYEELYAADQGNPLYNYRLGICYLNSNTKKDQALKYLQFASGHIDGANVRQDVLFFIGKAHHFIRRFDEAIAAYRKYKATMGGGESLQKDIDREIAICETGKLMVAHPLNVTIEPMGNEINSPYPEYGPLISADESVLLFTSRRPGSTGNKVEQGMYFEDIYISHRKGGSWAKPKKLNINTDQHEACKGLSADGQKLFIYKQIFDGSGVYGDRSVYYCELDGEDWSKPQKFPEDINTKHWETSIVISPDEKTVYFTSDRKGGYGGRDLYRSDRMPDGSWGPAKNLGPVINTPYDEESPFIHPDGRTLYFSSTGHNTMGGFDIFFSVYSPGAGGEEGAWSEPENIGYPINTTDDDVFFVLSADGNHAYLSSFREGGVGEKDIYLVAMPERIFRLTVMKGTVYDAETKTPLGADITITDNETSRVYSELKSNKTSGKYLITIPPDKNYGIAVSADGYLFHSENVYIPDQKKYNEVEKDVYLQPIRENTKIVLRNIFFDFDKSTLRPESKSELERLYKILQANPGMKIELSGHTDSRGNDDYNQRLSGERAKAVVSYLIAKGIEQSRLLAKGYGESQPMAPNENEDGSDNPEGRQLNRRTELKILSF